MHLRTCLHLLAVSSSESSRTPSLPAGSDSRANQDLRPFARPRDEAAPKIATDCLCERAGVDRIERGAPYGLMEGES
jgi:hypothetical protein